VVTVFRASCHCPLAPPQRLPRGHSLLSRADSTDDSSGYDVRPYAPGDSFNRIHWRSTARLGEIQVKEFDLEQTADVWIFVDLESTVAEGRG